MAFSAANATITSIAEAIIALAEGGYLRLGKRADGGARLPFNFQQQLDEGYVASFFTRGTFEMKLSHEGRNPIAEQGSRTPPPVPGESGAPAGDSTDWKFARLAIEEARKSVSEDDGRTHPKVGAVVVKEGQILDIGDSAPWRGQRKSRRVHCAGEEAR